jgi:hypothetical protein
MPTIARRGAPSEAEQFFIRLLADPPARLGLHRRTARLIWQMIAASQDEEARAFVYRTTELIATTREADTPTLERVMRAYFDEWLNPSLLHAAVSELEAREELHAGACARLHATIRQCCSADGTRWLFITKS